MDTIMSESGGAPPVDLNALLGRLLDEAEDENRKEPSPLPPASSADHDTDPPARPTAVSASPTAGANGAAGFPLGSLLANPTLLAALPTLAENVGPLLGNMSGGTGSSPKATRPHTVDRHTALLCAVKPYLSPQRQNAAETVIRLCRIWDALERSGISLSGLLTGLGGTVPANTPASDGEVT